MRKKMKLKAFTSLFRIHLAEGLQYRIAALSGGSISVFWALIEIAVYTAFYTHAANSQNFNGLTQVNMVTYIWLAQFLFPLQPMSIDGDIQTAIEKGDVAIALCRPLDLYWHWFCKTAAGRLSPFLLRLMVILPVSMLVPLNVRMGLPHSFVALMLFLLSACLAFMLCNAYGMLITAVRLNITWGNGPTYMLMLIGGILSGTYLPLRLWPDWMQGFLYLQPFAGYADLPIQLYLGLIGHTAAIQTLLMQGMWIGVFILMGRAVMHRKLDALIVQGG